MNASTEPLLVFDWKTPQGRGRALLGFVSASLLLHALCFYVFQIVYPSAVTLFPPPARVSLITNDSEEGRALLRWIEAEDPALASATQRPPEARARALPRIEHVPSYLNESPQLKQLPPQAIDLRAPTALPPGAVPIAQRTPSPKASIVRTTLSLSEELAGFGVPKLPDIIFAASTNEQPQDVRFRVAVNSRGQVQYAFPLNSSGDAALNEQARQLVALTRFPVRSTNESPVWGVATVHWGSDIARPAANETPSSP